MEIVGTFRAYRLRRQLGSHASSIGRSDRRRHATLMPRRLLQSWHTRCNMLRHSTIRTTRWHIPAVTSVFPDDPVGGEPGHVGDVEHAHAHPGGSRLPQPVDPALRLII